MPLEDELADDIEETFLSKFDRGYIVIDAIDECVDPAQIIPRLLRWTSTRWIKILLVSRDSSEVKKCLQHSPKLALTSEMLQKDVELFILEKVAQLVESKELRIRDQSLSTSIAIELSKNAEGM